MHTARLPYPSGLAILAGLALLLALPDRSAHASVVGIVEGETGIVLPGYNDIAIPGEGVGTRFSAISDPFEPDPSAFLRLRLGILIDDEHFLGVLGQPLQYDVSGTLDDPITFQDVTFNAGEFVRLSYRFNSWRLTYRYQGLDLGRDWTFGFGFTAKIRDAAISLENGTEKREETDIGFVPLLNLLVEWHPHHYDVGFRFEVDGLAAPQGRAFDILGAVTFQASDNIRLFVGYRLLEGGADNETLYNFTALHFATVGATLTIE